MICSVIFITHCVSTFILETRMSAKKIVMSLIFLGLAGLGAQKGYHWYQLGRFIEETDNAYVKADSVAIRAELSGRIDKVWVEENQHVSKGQVLVELDAEDYLAKLAEAKAQLAVAKAARVDAGEQILLQHKKLDEATASIDAAEATLTKTKLNLERFKVLQRQSFDSKQQLQNTQADVKIAKAQLAQAQASKAAAVQTLAVLEAQQQSADAQVESALASVQYAQHQLDKTRILAPKDGVIGSLSARDGGLVQPTLTLLHLVPLPDVYVVANFKETQIGHMSIGQPVAIRVDAEEAIAFEGVVESIAPATGNEFSLLPKDNATGNFNKIVQRVPVRIRVTGPANALPLLRPGLSVIPQVDTREFKTQQAYLQNTKRGDNADLAAN